MQFIKNFNNFNVIVPAGVLMATLFCVALIALSDYSSAYSTNSGQAKEADLPLRREPATSEIDTRLIENLFGHYSEQKNVISEVPVTRLDLKLVGTFTHSSAEKASALIKISNKTRLFNGGDEIAPGATIEKIEPGSIIILRNGLKEKVLIHDEELFSDTRDSSKSKEYKMAGTPSSQVAPKASHKATKTNLATKRAQPSLSERLQALRDRHKNQ